MINYLSAIVENPSHPSLRCLPASPGSLGRRSGFHGNLKQLKRVIISGENRDNNKKWEKVTRSRYCVISYDATAKLNKGRGRGQSDRWSLSGVSLEQ